MPSFGAARFTAQNVRSGGQDVSPGRCVPLSTSKAVRKSMKLWNKSWDGKPWKVELDVLHLGRHLDFTWGSGRLRMGWPWGLRLSWAWFEVRICLLGCMLLRLLTSLLRL